MNSQCRLVEEIYTITSYVERLDDNRKSLKDTIHDTCVVSNFESYENLIIL